MVFKGERGVTQGDPLSPTIFNVVVDAVVRHWVNGLVDEAEEKGETGREGRHQSVVFYADDGIVVSSDPVWIQGDFSDLVAIFDRVGLLTNVGKTVPQRQDVADDLMAPPDHGGQSGRLLRKIF